MSGVQCTQSVRPSGLHIRTKHPRRKHIRPSTPGSPEDLTFSLPPPSHTSPASTDFPAVDLESLRDRLESLPRELYDEILHFTLVCDAGTETFPSATKKGLPVVNTQFIDNTYKPPVQLALNRKIRQDTLPKFYSNTTFIFSDHGVLKRWMRSLPREAVVEIREARVVEVTASCIFTGIYTRPEHLIGKQQGDGADIWRTWDLSIETRQSSIGKTLRAQEFMNVARNWYKWH